MPVASGDPFKRSRAQGKRYAEAWAKMREAGVKPVVIEKAAREAWLRWRNWYVQHGLEMHVELMDANPAKTVPCLDPFEVVL